MRRKLIMIGSVSLAVVIVLFAARVYYVEESNRQFNQEAKVLREEQKAIQKVIDIHIEASLLSESEVSSVNQHLSDYNLSIEQKKMKDAKSQLRTYQKAIEEMIAKNVEQEFEKNTHIFEALIQQDLDGYSSEEYGQVMSLQENMKMLIGGKKTKDTVLLFQKNITDIKSVYASAEKRIVADAQKLLDQQERILRLENENLLLQQTRSIQGN